jgi:asparagine synthase (glutamine-hydrolysing)
MFDPARRWSETDAKQIGERMSAKIARRGPDDASTWRSPSGECMLAFRRLAILDLSESGRQPMQSSCRRWTIAFNGEIYNYLQIKAEIEQSGKYSNGFRGHSDTEVLLAALSIWGVDATLEKIEGMFAFALWDGDQKRLILARDRFGEKPLYYAWSNQTLLFGSEIHALAAYPGANFTVDEDALHAYFRLGYYPTPLTVYKEVKKVTPGHYVEVQEGDSENEQPYWRLSDFVSHAVANPYEGTRAEAVSQLDQLLSDSVRLRMVSDVPLGAFLSGGLDSSLIVATMQRQSRRPIQTFCIGFTEDTYNEAPFARKVAAHLGCDHQEWIISAKEAQSVIPTLGQVYDEPLADASQIPTLLVSALARKKVTVALSGDAGDELFAGYDRYRWANKLQPVIASAPKQIQKALGKALQVIPGTVWEKTYAPLKAMLPAEYQWNNAGEKIDKLASVLSSQDFDAVYQVLVSQWATPADILVRGHEPDPSRRMRDVPNQVDSLVGKMMYFDLARYLPDDVLTKVDRASMHHGLEVRVPLLDRKIVSLLWSLPMEWKLHQGQTKVLARELLKQHFPEAFFQRPKRGFSLPVDIWLRTGLKDWAETLLSEKALNQSGLLNTQTIRKIWQEHAAGLQNHQHKLWSVLQFQTWWDARKN